MSRETSGFQTAKRAITFSCPERVALDFRRFGVSDFEYVSPGIFAQRGGEPGYSWHGPGKKTDEWGCIWEAPPAGSGIVNEGMVKSHPLANATIKQLREYPFPDARDKRRYENLDGDLALPRRAGKYIWFEDFYTFFERCWALRGMERLLMDLHENEEFVYGLLERLTSFHLEVLDQLKPYRGRIHGYHIGDDWGTQAGAFISPGLFRKFFKPYYRKLIERAHSVGLNVRLHSDGRINDLIEDFIETGLDVIEINSPRMLGIDEVSKRFRGRIAFYVCVDIQATLPRGDAREIEFEARELIEKWGTDKGGIVGYSYAGLEAIGVPAETDRIGFDAFVKYGRYKDG